MNIRNELPDNGHFIQVNGIKMFYEDLGEGKPLIFIHGGIGSSRVLGWEKQIDFFVNYFRVIVPDCRGYGRTNNPDKILSYKLMMKDFVELIEKLELEKPFICGWSDGAQIALELGMSYPDVIGAIVVGGALLEINYRYIKGMKDIGILGEGEIDIEKFTNTLPDLATILSEIHSHVYGKEYWKEMLEIVSRMWLNPKEFPEDKVKSISVPTLIILGDRDDFITVEENAQMFRLIPNSEFAVIPNSGHDVCSKKPELFNQIVFEFLKKQ